MKPRIIFLVLAYIVLLLQWLLPHHHHQQETAFFLSACPVNDHSTCTQNDKDCTHTCDEDAECTSANHLVPTPERHGSSSDDAGLTVPPIPPILFTLVFPEWISTKNPTTYNHPPAFYEGVAHTTHGLRAPPYFC